MLVEGRSSNYNPNQLANVKQNVLVHSEFGICVGSGANNTVNFLFCGLWVKEPYCCVVVFFLFALT